MAESKPMWQRIGVDSDLERGPVSVPIVPHRGGHLELLPFVALTWPDFESLLWRILRDVEGFRHAQIYGDPGQAQLGLDIIAEAADGSGVALQSKRVAQFGPAKFTAAVNAFRKTNRPFPVSRFILGISREIRSTPALDRFKELQRDLKQESKPVALELWDRRELSQRLKRAPAIVIDYFGKEIAEIFCDSFVITPVTVPRREAIAIRQAMARTPEETTGAGEKIVQATALAQANPETALALVEQAQELLTKAAFVGHAAQHETLRSSLLLAMGRGDEATRRRLDQLWIALEQGHSTLADMASHEITKLAEQVKLRRVRDHKSVAERAVQLYNNPLAFVPDLADLLIGDSLDRARLALLAGETALAAGDNAWLKRNSRRMRNLVGKLPAGAQNEVLQVRLRLLVAEGSGNWAAVLGDARGLRFGYELCALIQARNARHLACDQKFAEADASWDEASGNACLAERWTDASRWIFSRRAFRGRWRPFTADELLPVQTALSAYGPDGTVLARDEDALEYAYARMAEGKLRPATIAAQRALRDAVTLSDWEGERRARRLLADALSASGEHLAAANHLVLAGEIKALEQLAAAQANQFLDVTAQLKAKPWWVAGAAFRLIAAQADLVPDDMVCVIADHAIAVLRAAQKGKLVDLSAFTSSRYLSAIATLAGISGRLTREQAEDVLCYFEGQPPVEPNHYRYHDKDEAEAVARILGSRPELSERALAHLIHLLDRSDSSRKSSTYEAITTRMTQARPYLEELAASGSAWARELLTSEYPEQASNEQVQEARARLEAALVHTPGVFTVGSGSRSVSDSILVRTLPESDQQAALEQLLERGASPYVSALDRASYLIAASNLHPPTERAARVEILNRSLALVLSPPKYLMDTMDARFEHPLGAVQMLGRQDSRGEAAHLAATLAETYEEKEQVRNAALGLVNDPGVSEVWVTRALQRLGDTMAPDIGFLSGQNWALRSFSAILWSKFTQPEPVGYRLAADGDVRVRRALAVHLVQCQGDEDEERLTESDGGASAKERRRHIRATILDLLREDPRFSVRAAVTTVQTTQ